MQAVHIILIEMKFASTVQTFSSNHYLMKVNTAVVYERDVPNGALLKLNMLHLLI